MSALSNWLEARVMDFIFKNNALGWTSPGDALYVALFAGNGGLEENTQTNEVSTPGTGYERQQVPAADWTRTGSVVVNAEDIDFPVATAAWGTITHAAIMSAVSGGEVLWHGALESSKAIAEDDQFRILAGDLEAEID